MTFGEKIHTLRKNAGLSQEELAEKLDVSRQAISKWERGAGYPETEKIIRMSRLFGVSLDYLLGEDQDDAGTQEEPEAPEETEAQDFFVSEEDARGFLDQQKRKGLKKGLGLCAILLGLACIMSDYRAGEILFVVLTLAGALLLVSAFTSDDMYRKMRFEPLRLGAGLREELNAEYLGLSGRAHALSLAGLAMVLAGFLLPPFIDTGMNYRLDAFLTEAGLALVGIGFFLWIYFSGLVKAYRVLIMNEEYREKEK